MDLSLGGDGVHEELQVFCFFVEHSAELLVSLVDSVRQLLFVIGTLLLDVLEFVKAEAVVALDLGVNLLSRLIDVLLQKLLCLVNSRSNLTDFLCISGEVPLLLIQLLFV